MLSFLLLVYQFKFLELGFYRTQCPCNMKLINKQHPSQCNLFVEGKRWKIYQEQEMKDKELTRQKFEY